MFRAITGLALILLSNWLSPGTATASIPVDLQNVQPKNMALLVGGAFRIMVFVGATQAKIPLKMARALQVFGP